MHASPCAALQPYCGCIEWCGCPGWWPARVGCDHDACRALPLGCIGFLVEEEWIDGSNEQMEHAGHGSWIELPQSPQQSRNMRCGSLLFLYIERIRSSGQTRRPQRARASSRASSHPRRLFRRARADLGGGVISSTRNESEGGEGESPEQKQAASFPANRTMGVAAVGRGRLPGVNLSQEGGYMYRASWDARPLRTPGRQKTPQEVLHDGPAATAARTSRTHHWPPVGS